MKVAHESGTHSGSIGESMKELKQTATGPQGVIPVTPFDQKSRTLTEKKACTKKRTLSKERPWVSRGAGFYDAILIFIASMRLCLRISISIEKPPHRPKNAMMTYQYSQPWASCVASSTRPVSIMPTAEP